MQGFKRLVGAFLCLFCVIGSQISAAQMDGTPEQNAEDLKQEIYENTGIRIEGSVEEWLRFQQEANPEILNVRDLVVRIDVDKSRQRMYVYANENLIHIWPVSTGRAGFGTPTGSWTPYVLKPMHYSKKYDNAPMPFSIFYSGGFAIHETGDLGNLGRPASHGCVRLSGGNARELYTLVERAGKVNTRVNIYEQIAYAPSLDTRGQGQSSPKGKIKKTFKKVKNNFCKNFGLPCKKSADI